MQFTFTKILLHQYTKMVGIYFLEHLKENGGSSNVSTCNRCCQYNWWSSLVWPSLSCSLHVICAGMLSPVVLPYGTDMLCWSGDQLWSVIIASDMDCTTHSGNQNLSLDLLHKWLASGRVLWATMQWVCWAQNDSGLLLLGLVCCLLLCQLL